MKRECCSSGPASRNAALVLLAMLLMAAMTMPVLADTKVVYVATTGDDVSGAGSSANPYATIDKARQVIREAHPLQHPYEVRIRGGVYYLTSTLTLTSADSGTASCPVTYLAYNNEDVVVSGGKPISLTWWKQSATLWSCRLANAIPDYASRDIRHIWKDGVKQTLARYPNVGQGTPAGYMLTTTAASSQTMATVPQANVHGDWTGGEFTIFGPDGSDIATNTVGIASVAGKNIYFDPAVSPYFSPQTRGRRCYVRNVFSECDSPGEWFLGTTPGHFADGWLYIYHASDTPPTGSYVVGYLETVLKVDDGAPYYQPVSYVNFRGLKFTQTTCTEHSQYWIPWKFSVIFRNADHCKVENCRFVDLAGSALAINPNCEYITVKDCLISNVDSGGIVFIPEGPPFPGTPDYYTHNLITGNEIHHVGEVYKGSDAIELTYISYNTFENNYIHDIPCHAFTISGSTLGHNIIRNNEMRNALAETGDCGVIHTFPLDMSDPTESGNEISGNLAINSKGYYYDANSILHQEWGYGYYIDNTSQGWTIHDNVAKDCFGGLMFHGARECDVYNNFWINNLRQSSFWCTTIMVDPDLMGWFNVHQNISYASSAYTQHEIFGGSNAEWLTGHGVTINNNVFYPNGTGDPRIPSRVGALSSFGGTGLATWTQWRSTYGYDTASVIANPLFQDIGADDYRLQAGSPATALGIHGIDFGITITQHPASRLVAANQRVVLSVAVTGLAPRYQWYLKSMGAGSYNAIAGATQSTYAIDSAKPYHLGDYYVVVSNCRGSWTSNVASLRYKANTMCDYDGDGDTDIGEWVPVSGRWNSRDAGALFTLGRNGDYPLWGDFNADDRSDAAICRTNNQASAAEWHIDFTGTTPSYDLYGWGWEGRIPITGDYDGDGDTGFGEFIASTGAWSAASIGTVGVLGRNGDIPIPADYDGDGATDVAICRPGTTNTWIINYSGGGSLTVTGWGNENQTPVCGDYNGDGKADFGTFNGTVMNVRGVLSVAIGQAGDVPLMGDYDGDGITDCAVYHPDPVDGSSDWLIRYSSDGQRHDVANWGASGGTPFASNIAGWNGIITRQPVNQTEASGERATFSVVAQGAGVTCQWYKNNSAISGATSFSYTKSNIQSADAGAYKCVVTNRTGYARNSNTAILVVGNSVPQLKALQDGTEIVGGVGYISATFSDCFYIANPTIFGGIRIEYAGSIPQDGAKVTIRGTMRTKAGERYIAATSVTAD